MKYKEDLVVKEFMDHVKSTYSEHYSSEEGVQVLDIWKALGNFDTSCRDAAIKYLFRFGKKKGLNKEDLLKAMHFIVYIYQYHFIDNPEPQPKKNVVKLKAA